MHSLITMPTKIGPRHPKRLYIALWREHRGLTQEQLALRIGSTDVSVSRWETGRREPSLSALQAISEALGIDLIDIYRHPKSPSADALLRDQPADVRDQAIRLIQAIRR